MLSLILCMVLLKILFLFTPFDIFSDYYIFSAFGIFCGSSLAVFAYFAPVCYFMIFIISFRFYACVFLFLLFSFCFGGSVFDLFTFFVYTADFSLFLVGGFWCCHCFQFCYWFLWCHISFCYCLFCCLLFSLYLFIFLLLVSFLYFHSLTTLNIYIYIILLLFLNYLCFWQELFQLVCWFWCFLVISLFLFPLIMSVANSYFIFWTVLLLSPILTLSLMQIIFSIPDFYIFYSFNLFYEFGIFLWEWFPHFLRFNLTILLRLVISFWFVFMIFQRSLVLMWFGWIFISLLLLLLLLVFMSLMLLLFVFFVFFLISMIDPFYDFADFVVLERTVCFVFLIFQVCHLFQFCYLLYCVLKGVCCYGLLFCYFCSFILHVKTLLLFYCHWFTVLLKLLSFC